MRRMLLGLIGLFLLPPLARAEEPAVGAKVYRQALPSIVWIHSKRDNGLATGSGTLIDAERRIVLTNYHVVEENPNATIFFPVLRDGKPIAEKRYYTERADRLGIRGRVLGLDKQADLALIRLEQIPAGTKGIPLAAGSPDPGESVQSIGNAGDSGALWGYVKGTVRQVYRKKWKAQLGRNVVTFEAKVVETDSATNPGDSGGPLLNDRGELVGVTQGGAIKAQLISTFIDISEVKQLLAQKGVREPAPPPAAPPAPPRTEAIAIQDQAKLFSTDTVKSVTEMTQALYRKNLDVVIETYPKMPEAFREKAIKVSPAERQALFRDYARERMKAVKARGVVILVSLDPRYVAVEIDDEDKKRFPEGQAQKVADALIKGLKEKMPDQGLMNAVTMIRDSDQGEKK